MPPLHSGDPGDGQGDEGDEGVEFRPPLPPEDRIWRHPSEVVAIAAPTGQTRGDTTSARTPRLLGVITVSGLIGATLSLGVVAAMGGFSTETRLVERQVAIQPLSEARNEADTVAGVTSRTAPAVAAVRVDRDGETAAGSAIVYRSDGHLLTNAHLVDGADYIEVRLHGGRSATATVVGADPVTDVAVLHVELTGLVPAALGSAQMVEVGDLAIAVGTLDEGGWSTAVTAGMVSALHQRMQTPAGRVLYGMMAVDIRLADGVSGGPLLDTNGAVIAMTTGHDDSGDGSVAEQGWGLATPIDVATHVADQLIEFGAARHVWLGIEGTDLDSGDAVDLGIAGGAEVERVMAASPAAEIDLRTGDVLVAVDDTPVDSMSDLITALRTRMPGDEVTFTVRRGDASLTIVAVLAERT